MFAAPGTAFGGLTADKAAPLRKAKFLPRQLPSVGIKDIHIKKTAQTVLIFKACRNVFHGSSGPVEDIVFFIAGLIIDDFMKRMGIPAPTRAFSRRRTPSSNPIRIRGDTFCGPGMFIVKTAAVCGTARGASAEPRPVRPEPAAYRGLPREVPEVQ